MTKKNTKKPATEPVINRTIEMTTDYDMFKHVKGNRALVEKHIKSIMAAIQANDLCIPIVINKDNEVIDGQHTLEARKRLNEIVFYYVEPDYTLEHIQRFNVIKRKWTSDDYASSYIDSGNNNYVIYRDFKARYKFPHVITVELLHSTERGHGKLSDLFIGGQLVVADLAEAERKARLIEEIAPYFKGYRDRNFVSAYLKVMGNKKFNHRKFVQKLQTRPAAICKCASVDQYLALIEDIFNYYNKHKVSLKYDG